ncbi:MAG: HAMP domain-containing histidine kinase [Archaeoglobaceae archaeon]|nr:HAMP domain-containing histidine kinase [Archaeoglobaceae archaeon]MDW8117517.1 HAMP domain-containing sensor histidine kinase [Archaeoglobaceae archaeon]
MTSRIDLRVYTVIMLIAISVIPSLSIPFLRALNMPEELKIAQFLIILYGISAILLSFLISILLIRNLEGESKILMKHLGLTLFLMVIYISYLLSSIITERIQYNIATFTPYIISYIPLLIYGIKKFIREIKFITPKKLTLPIVVSTAVFLGIISNPIPEIILMITVLNLIVLFVFLSLTAIYLNTETVNYWIMISLAYILQFPAVGYLTNTEFYTIPAMFYNLSFSVFLFYLYDLHGKKVKVLSFDALEEERKKYAQLLDKMNDMKEAFRLMSRALRYDVLKKLQLISGFVEVYDLTKQQEYLEKAIKGVKEAGEYIEKIGSLEKTVSTEETTLKPINVRNLVEEIKSNYEIPIVVKGSCTVLAGDEISLAIENLIENAIRHSGTDRIEVVLSEIENEGEIRVIDYGTGIPKEIKKELFKEGFRYGETAGLGFGLYIVKKIVERYDGRVWVEDTKPTGATFVIRLKTIQTSERR